VVTDFGARLGLDIAPGSTPRENEALSAEATALLFLQRRLGPGFGGEQQKGPGFNTRFVERLRRIGGRPLDFAPMLWGPIEERFQADRDWAEARLGASLADHAPASDAVLIGGEEDLLALAAEAAPRLDRLLDELGLQAGRAESNGTEALLAALELLHAPAPGEAGRRRAAGAATA
jgi:hypothetical protein